MLKTQPKSQLPSDQKSVGMRTRPELIIQPSVFQGEKCWVVKDPLAMKFFRVHDGEWKVLEALRDEISYRQLKDMLTAHFPEKSIRSSAIHHLVVSLYRNGLLISDWDGQAAILEQRRKQDQRDKWLRLFSSWASPRFPGVDPTRLLNYLYPKVRFLFAPWFVGLAAMLCLAALLLVATNFAEFYARLPEFHQFFAVQNLVLIWAILIFTKSIHELGHGLMCKHFGGECHEIGFMLLLMTPAMYCNTSDSWVLPNRWHRVAIGAGGMYLEVLLASICTFVWWYTNSGWVHYVAMNVMFLCSISTILFNANPLLRMDGYYMLSDFWEIPNLNQRARQFLITTLQQVCLGASSAQSSVLPRRHRAAFVAFSVASTVYRWAMFVGIYWFLRSIAQPYGLMVLVNALALTSLIGMLVRPLMQIVQYFRYPGRARELKRKNVGLSICSAGALFLACCWVPLPRYVFGPIQIRPLEAQWVMVSEPGAIRSILVQPGDKVKQGDVICRLENPILERELLALHGELAALQSNLASYQGNQDRLIDSERLIVEAKVQIENLQAMMVAKQGQLDRLVLKADRDGTVIAPPNVPERPREDFELPTWTGRPLDTKNLGAFLSANTLVCLIGDPQRLEAVVYVEQSDVQLVQPEHIAKVMVDTVINQNIPGLVAAVAQNELSSVPRELSQTFGGPIAVKMATQETEEPVNKLYEVCVDLDVEEGRATNSLASGQSGFARIHTGTSTVAGMTGRYLRNLINFH